LPVDPRAVPRFLPRLGHRTAEAYLAAVAAATLPGTRITAAALDHVIGLLLVRTADLPLSHRDLIARIGRQAIDAWRVEDTERLVAALRPYRPEYAERLAEHAQRRLSTSKKLVRRFTQRRPKRDTGEG
ncbi:hypothetical protein AB0D04_18885, partial [Streptomyces sp. NPDC048483]